MSRLLIDSGFEWIGKIPSEWNIVKVNKIFYRRKEVNEEENPTILSLARSGVKIRDISNNEGQLAESYDNYHKVYIGDLMLNPMDLISGANCSISEVEGVISPAYINLAKKEECNPKYYDYFFKNQYWVNAMFIHGKGVSFDNRWTINAETLMNYKIPLPPLEEQNKIATYLDKKCFIIDKTIEDNNKAIEKLEEYKKSIINDAVSLGVNRNVSLKDTGIQFFKKIPSHWNIKKLKYIIDSFSKGNGITKEEVFENGDIQCVRYGEIYSKYEHSFSKTKSRTFIDKINSPKYIYYGDILCAATGELVEEIGKNIVYLGKEPCIVGGDIIIIKHSQNSRYLNYLLNSTLSQEQKSGGKAKLKVVHIYSSELGKILLPIPPLEEQEKIATYLDKTCTNINKIIEYRKKIIVKLEEYKKSLIYEVVTGKKEV